MTWPRFRFNSPGHCDESVAVLQRLAWGLLWQLRYSDWMWKTLLVKVLCENATQLEWIKCFTGEYLVVSTCHDRMSGDSGLSFCLALDSHQMLPRTERKREKERTRRRSNQKEENRKDLTNRYNWGVPLPTTWVAFKNFVGEPELPQISRL